MQSSGDTAVEATNWLAAQEAAMVDLLRRIVDIDSGSYDKPGIDRVVEILAGFLASHGIQTETFAQERNGNVMRAQIGPRVNTGPVLLMGHCDTVFPQGEAARRPFTVRDGRAYGPGVADMKAGLVMNSFVMAALARRDDLETPVVALFTSDEEIASPASRDIIRAEARGARVVFNAEPGRPGGEVVTGRRACMFFKAEISGRAAHSGTSFLTGRSAILELAEKTVRLHGLMDAQRGISVNVGLVSGGQSVNVVAPQASFEFDVRYSDPADFEALMAKIEEIMNTAHVPDTRTTFHMGGSFPPLFETADSRVVFEHYREAAGAEGIALEGISTGGSADSGFASEAGAPTLCGTGPVGGNYHSPEEYIELPSLLRRAQILARAILTLGEAPGLRFR